MATSYGVSSTTTSMSTMLLYGCGMSTISVLAIRLIAYRRDDSFRAMRDCPAGCKPKEPDS
jgi:hypothetical protein